MILPHKVDTTFLIRRKIISELDNLSLKSNLKDNEIEIWNKKWINKDRSIFINTLLFQAQRLSFPLAKEKKKGWIITRIFEILNDPALPQYILNYLKRIKISIPLLIVLDPVFEFYNSRDKIDEFIDHIPKSKTLEAGRNIARLLIDGRTKSRFEFLMFLNEFSFSDVSVNIKVLNNLAVLKDINLLNLYEFLIESNQKPLIKQIITLIESIKHTESLIFLKKIIKRFKNDTQIVNLAEETIKKIIISGEISKNTQARSKIDLSSLTPFDQIYITPIEDNFTFSLHFINLKKNIYILLYCDLIIGIANFELLENVSKKQLAEFIEHEKNEKILLSISYDYAIRTIRDAFFTSTEAQTTPFFFIGLRKLLSKEQIKPQPMSIKWQQQKQVLEQFKAQEKIAELTEIKGTRQKEMIEKILSTPFTEDWYYFTKKAKRMFHDLKGAVDAKKNKKSQKDPDRVHSIYFDFVKKYIFPDIDFWVLTIQRTLDLMLHQNEKLKAYYLYDLTRPVIENFHNLKTLPKNEMIDKILNEKFFLFMVEKSLYLSGTTTGEKEKFFEDHLFDDPDSSD
ncbi:MAG: hypothetical protein JW827_01345 [Spirochaetes bacterium]|nr:hypothetical protein [Spirochaetota bacterium]